MTDALRFPPGFIWGTATAAYQIEGAVDEGGRSESIWDAFARTPGKTLDGATGEVACDHYHRYKEDIQHMKRLGLRHYRFSIAWPRIIPGGTGPVNHEAIRHYNELITELLENGIEPMVTLYHWDLPLALQVEYDGWLGGEIVQEAFVRYARVCFEYFGPRVKTWLTLNEPWCSALLGHGWGVHAPGRRKNSQTEAYVAGHNLLLAHAKAVDLYRREFKPIQRGKIGITLNCDWSEPKPSEDPLELQRNEEAAERSLQWFFGWFADPIYKGDYPTVMRERAGDRLPKFTDAEKKLLLNSSDFLGLNSYSTRLVASSEAWLKAPPADGLGTIDDDAGVDVSLDESWTLTDMGWPVVPEGFEKLLLWIHTRYAPPGGIYVTENGCACPDATRDEALNDDFRVDYFRRYIAAMHRAIEQGADVKAYYAWSLMDNYEWAFGYSKRFGLLYVDYETQERVPKKSAHFISEVAKKNAVLP